MTDFREQIKFAFRKLWRAKLFAVVATLTLALGIGANSGVFSLINAVILNPFPYPEPERILQIGESSNSDPQSRFPTTYPTFLDWQAQAKSFSALGFVMSETSHLLVRDDAKRVRRVNISADIWPTMGVAAELGRVFTRDEDRVGAPPIVVLSHALWQSQFGARVDVIGESIKLGSQNFTVIGVMPARFKFWDGALWTPVGQQADTPLLRSRTARADYWVVGRLREGISMETAREELASIHRGIVETYPEAGANTPSVMRLVDTVSTTFRPVIMMLFFCVLGVLLIACLNVANLLMAKYSARSRELSVRAGVGASRAKLIQQVLFESVPLAFLGGIAGLVFGWLTLTLLMAWLPPDSLPAEALVQIDWRVLVFTAVIAMATVPLFGLLAAFASVPKDPAGELRAPATAGTRRGGRLRSALMAVEVGVAVVLCIGAALMMRSLERLQNQALGFNPEQLSLAAIALPESYEIPAAAQFFEQLMERAKSIPGVQSVAANSTVPLSGQFNFPLLLEGKTYDKMEALESVAFAPTMGDELGALGLELKRGRWFEANDRAGSEPVMVLNESTAKHFFPSEDPLNKRVMLGVPESLLKPGMIPPGLDQFQWARVIGIVSDARYNGSGSEFSQVVYLPYTQAFPFPELRRQMELMVRVKPEVDASLVTTQLRALIREQDRNLPIDFTTMRAEVDTSFAQPRFASRMLGGFGALALLLACIGVYGLVAWNVLQRTREVGVRLALGGNKSAMMRLLTFQGLRVVGVGLLLGVVLALALSRLVQSMLFEVSPLDPLSFSLVPALLLLVGGLACYLPARRIAQVDSITALRSD